MLGSQLARRRALCLYLLEIYCRRLTNLNFIGGNDFPTSTTSETLKRIVVHSRPFIPDLSEWVLMFQSKWRLMFQSKWFTLMLALNTFACLACSLVLLILTITPHIDRHIEATNTRSARTCIPLALLPQVVPTVESRPLGTMAEPLESRARLGVHWRPEITCSPTSATRPQMVKWTRGKPTMFASIRATRRGWAILETIAAQTPISAHSRASAHRPRGAHHMPRPHSAVAPC